MSRARRDKLIMGKREKGFCVFLCLWYSTDFCGCTPGFVLLFWCSFVCTPAFVLLLLCICVYAPVFVHLGLCSLVLQLLSVFWPVSIKCTHTYITDHNNVLIGWQSCVSEDVLYFYQCVLSLCPLIHWWTLHCTCSNWGRQNFISASICAPVFLACAWLVIGQREVQSWKRGSDASPNHTIRSKLLSLQSVTMSWNVLRCVPMCNDIS